MAVGNLAFVCAANAETTDQQVVTLAATCRLEIAVSDLMHVASQHSRAVLCCWIVIGSHVEDKLLEAKGQDLVSTNGIGAVCSASSIMEGSFS